MAFAEVGEVAEMGGAAVGGVAGVVQIASMGRLSATGESAAFVAGAKESLHGIAGPVAVDGEDLSGDG